LPAPAASILVAAFAGGRLVPYWTQIFMDSAARFVAQFFPIFLLGALFGKLMEDSGSVTAIADFNLRKFQVPVGSKSTESVTAAFDASLGEVMQRVVDWMQKSEQTGT
jgi:H+/gluconate symporter-like permease